MAAKRGCYTSHPGSISTQGTSAADSLGPMKLCTYSYRPVYKNRITIGVACPCHAGLHKPDDQTVLLPPEAASFVVPLPVRALPGVGHKVRVSMDHGFLMGVCH